ncbi:MULTISPECIES: biofilm regulation protein phosphatase SiaA [Halomonas]|uniref:biofilm regulation protein phosphatase SiaA n=1 Tax=Halomonas TaxID=2745 RepID=UPI001C96E438|nr:MULTISPECIES: biofilm regulation protein phosphatase SiaA [Halomonas]MBY5969305.1 biofilm regulation protein phosphatase SiaA [Halomonas denitrificans]MBY6030618.1 biofilm regulation protein phosphatase SiaA [Halomonas sp. DP8Y7-1]MED5296722.1 biofilm regulation protein phosphatase SiaA [Pseudomonadota bacterium]
MSRHLGLRVKSLLVPLLSFLMALVPMVWIGMHALQDLERHFVQRYAEQYSRLHLQRMLTPLSRELALAKRFGDMAVTREWLADIDNQELKARFFREAEGFRQQFDGDDYYVVHHQTGQLYYNDGRLEESRDPRYSLDADSDEDAWYFRAMDSGAPFGVQVAYSRALNTTRVWVNVRVDGVDQPLGMVGGGLNFQHLLASSFDDQSQGVSSYVLDQQGQVMATAEGGDFQATDLSRDAGEMKTLSPLVEDADALQQMLTQARDGDEDVINSTLVWGGDEREVAVSYLPELDWWLVSAIDPYAMQLLEKRWLMPLLVALLSGLAIMLVAVVFTLQRLIVGPVQRLSRSAQALARGQYDVELDSDRGDEIGDLSRDFQRMADQVMAHTDELEERIRHRTAALESANHQMSEAKRQIDDSLECARALQQAILPRRDLTQCAGLHHGVLWNPRDAVGGDIFVFRNAGHGYLLGVIDCAGHGVPGALMTMLARAAFDNSVNQVGPEDPAAILTEMDRRIRRTLLGETESEAVTPHMDVGLVWVEADERRLTYAGAKLDLYVTDGSQLQVLAGGRRALAYKRPGEYRNQTLEVAPGWSCTLCSDGFLDQAGGKDGFGFGKRRFEAMLMTHAALTPSAQVAAFLQELEHFQGDQRQRDDITLLCFQPVAATSEPSAEATTHISHGLDEDTPWTS